MNPLVGWALAALALVAGYQTYGWQGFALAVTLVAFWLVLQFNRSIRVMRNAGAAPVGHVDSAVMLNAKLRSGLQMLEVLTLTKSLGRRVGPEADVFAWRDDGGSEVVVTFENGRCRRWTLKRPAQMPE
jgi:uncharacterized protein (DUF58 family)